MLTRNLKDFHKLNNKEYKTTVNNTSHMIFDEIDYGRKRIIENQVAISIKYKVLHAYFKNYKYIISNSYNEVNADICKNYLQYIHDLYKTEESDCYCLVQEHLNPKDILTENGSTQKENDRISVLEDKKLKSNDN
ncbi:PIR protein [Plasmodium brasilianum]|uniref:PIR protein n=1 Tax=Plasmodium brasilianum TaxID=5824 RepID=A0ACB9YC12_PLABR|nr:PIR protein [Plasmodium brasilianum]